MKKTYLNELWRDIKGFEGRYQISNYGRIKCCTYTYKCGHRNEQINIVKEHIMSPSTNHKGYLTIRLSDGSKRKNFLIHRLVANAFIPNPNNLPQVNHKDENKTNNFVWVNEDGSIDLEKSNLEWCTNDYNIHYGTGVKRRTKKLSHRVLQKKSDGTPYFCYFSLHDAEIDINGKYTGTISRICNGVRGKTCKGYMWSYIDEK